ncbi:hypothetical protein HHK36_021396 [Tetracentron sinense]|uniref:Uncharacterized protein n=1 Tax=Tetracentron sinense TaxID=13715 RepID=A0A834YS23_TETSI|nr:hypothetical protein HHK36_021396 [Tetracentron sinense]
MAILYGLVARGSVVLAEFSATSTNASTIARQILEKIPGNNDSHVSYSQDRYIFHVKRTDGLTVLCMADDTAGTTLAVDKALSVGKQVVLVSLETLESPTILKLKCLQHLQHLRFYSTALESLASELGSFNCRDFRIYHWQGGAREVIGRIPFAFLEDIHQRFVKAYGRAVHSALAYAMNDEFSRVLSQQMEYYSNDPNADRINRLKGEMSQVRNVMIENIDKVLERGDRLELLVDKTANMQGNTFRFRKQARRFKNTVWWRNVKLTYVH